MKSIRIWEKEWWTAWRAGWFVVFVSFSWLSNPPSGPVGAIAAAVGAAIALWVWVQFYTAVNRVLGRQNVDAGEVGD